MTMLGRPIVRKETCLMNRERLDQENIVEGVKVELKKLPTASKN